MAPGSYETHHFMVKVGFMANKQVNVIKIMGHLELTILNVTVIC